MLIDNTDLALAHIELPLRPPHWSRPAQMCRGGRQAGEEERRKHCQFELSHEWRTPAAPVAVVPPPAPAVRVRWTYEGNPEVGAPVAPPAGADGAARALRRLEDLETPPAQFVLQPQELAPGLHRFHAALCLYMVKEWKRRGLGVQDFGFFKKEVEHLALKKPNRLLSAIKAFDAGPTAADISGIDHREQAKPAAGKGKDMVTFG